MKKNVQKEAKSNMKRVQYEKSSMKIVQHEKRAT